MKIIIDIDEKDKRILDKIKDNSFIPKPNLNAILDAVRNGTPFEDTITIEERRGKNSEYDSKINEDLGILGG